MTEDERIEAFWKAVDAAEEDLGVMLGVHIDEEGNAAPMAMALEHVAEEVGVH
jgi:hypothetical protein